ncbi:MAG: ABC transporter permease [Aeromicrobium erythreum]
MSGVDPARPGVAVLVLLGIAVAGARLARVRMAGDLAAATVRAVVQLALVALVIAWVFRHPEGAAVYLGVMLVAATVTAGRRIDCGGALVPRVGVAIGLGALAALVPVLLTGALAPEPRAVLPFAAQVMGGSMTAAALAGSRLRDEATTGWDQVEGWLALGATPRQAVGPFGRIAVTRALSPAVDQTRSAGLVTLPGAFVGLLLGGAGPAQAAEVQVLVLVGLVAAETVSAAALVRLLGPSYGTARPGPDRGRSER